MIKVLFIFQKEDESDSSNESYYNQENFLLQEIINDQAITAYDAAINKEFMVEYQRITNLTNNKINESIVLLI